MIRRRRPLLRAAAVGAVGYSAGRLAANAATHTAQQDAQLAQMQQQLDEQQYAAPPPAQPAPPTPPAAAAADPEAAKFATLTRLKEMLDKGILTQQEFDTEKQKVLQGS